jgi:hypothetical protein
MRAGGAETTKAWGAAPGKAIKQVEALKARTNHTRFQRVFVFLWSPGAGAKRTPQLRLNRSLLSLSCSLAPILGPKFALDRSFRTGPTSQPDEPERLRRKSREVAAP